MRRLFSQSGCRIPSCSVVFVHVLSKVSRLRLSALRFEVVRKHVNKGRVGSCSVLNQDAKRGVCCDGRCKVN